MSTKKDRFSSTDKTYMQLALNLAKAREGLTGTNPSVGCVITKKNKIISIGQTSYSGRPHAETVAIKNCTENLNGSKMYVTLEPCSHQGKTAPCTKSIINSKISEVIFSIEDVDKRVKGKTKKILNLKKIKTKTGLLKNSVKDFYKSYFFNRKHKLPYVTCKIAVSKNNLIYSKKVKKITNSLSNQFTHYLRLRNDSIMISYKTLNKDNPKLNCRLKNFKKFSPKRIILDNKLNSNTKSYLFKTANKNNTIIFYNMANKSKIIEFKKKKLNLIKSKINKYQKFDIKIIMKTLYKLGIRNILVEGGNDLTNNFIEKRLFNQFYLFQCPKILSIKNEYKIFSGLKNLKKIYKSKFKTKLNFGNDQLMIYKN